MAILGIDLGTTNSLGAMYIDGDVCLIPNSLGEYLTPSVVSFDDDGSVYVGAVAKERLITHPERTFASFKRNMGMDKCYALGRKNYSSEDLSSFVVRSIVEDAERYVADMDGVTIDEVVISVPAYFQDKQRVATKQAGALAGVKVHRIVNEPSAAALAIYNDQKQEEMILVFDFGGGTLDVSIVDCFENVVEIISVAGDNHLGGDDFNRVIADIFLKDNDLTINDLSKKEYAILLKNSEICKRVITDEGKGVVSLVYKDNKLSAEVTTQRLMEESGWIFNKIKTVLERALRDAELTVLDIDSVVMAGGSSNMPVVRTFLNLLFQDTDLIFGSGEELIARGVGLIAGIIERNANLKEVIMTDICPFSMGINVENHADSSNPYMYTIIARNNSLPCSKTETFYTSYDYQTSLTVKVLQGENVYADDNIKLGEFHVKVPSKKKGEASIDVTFTYDINGVLIVDVLNNTNGQLETKVISQKLEGDELKKEVESLNKFKLKTADDKKNDITKARLMAAYEMATIYNREKIGNLLKDYEYELARGDNRSIRRIRKFIKALLDAYEKNLDDFDVFNPQFSDPQDRFDDDDDD